LHKKALTSGIADIVGMVCNTSQMLATYLTNLTHSTWL
jgi:hypothetical protein